MFSRSSFLLRGSTSPLEGWVVLRPPAPQKASPYSPKHLPQGKHPFHYAVTLKVASETFTNLLRRPPPHLESPNTIPKLYNKCLSSEIDLFRLGFKEPKSNKIHKGKHGGINFALVNLDIDLLHQASKYQGDWRAREGDLVEMKLKNNGGER